MASQSAAATTECTNNARRFAEYFVRRLESGPSVQQVEASLHLLNGGCTIPFVARYRRHETGEATAQLLTEWRDAYQEWINVEKKRRSILKQLSERDGGRLLTPALRASLNAADTMERLEDLWLPFKQRKATRAQRARDQGFAPLFERIWSSGVPNSQLRSELQRAAKKLSITVEDAKSALRDLCAEQIAADTTVRDFVRQQFRRHGVVLTKTRSAATKESSASRLTNSKPRRGVYHTYADWQCSLRFLKPHQTLAIERGNKEKCLSLTLKLVLPSVRSMTQQKAAESLKKYLVPRLRACAGRKFKPEAGFRHCELLIDDATRDAWTRLIRPAVCRDMRREMLKAARAAALQSFSSNLRDLLLTPPRHGIRILAMDPGFRAGCKLAAIDERGNVIRTATVYPHQPQNKWQEAADVMQRLLTECHIRLIALGNGTASRESEMFISEMVRRNPDLRYVIVDEAGASVYSTSEAAASEFGSAVDPLHVSAISLARRCQDPLSELVKVPPSSIGVGMYQHDMPKATLRKRLEETCEQVVCDVGVDVNVASEYILRRVAGLSKSQARAIFDSARLQGFQSRASIRSVAGIGDMTYQQAAGFLRVSNSNEPLDATRVHPEHYELARQIIASAACTSGAALPTPEMLRGVDIVSFCERTGTPLVLAKDIIEFLKQPNELADPRRLMKHEPERTGPRELSEIRVGMKMAGVVRNVVDFGAFVDIGTKSDGLLHRSQVSEPFAALAIGQCVQVTVIAVDLERKRISLSMFSQQQGVNSMRARMHVQRTSKKRSRRGEDAGASGGDKTKRRRRGRRRKQEGRR